MRKLILTLMFCFMASVCFADKYYVLIEKNNNVTDKEAEVAEYGDVHLVMPFTEQYKPTPAEKSTFLTKSEFTKLNPSCWPDLTRNGRYTSISFI